MSMHPPRPVGPSRRRLLAGMPALLLAPSAALATADADRGAAITELAEALAKLIAAELGGDASSIGITIGWEPDRGGSAHLRARALRKEWSPEPRFRNGGHWIEREVGSLAMVCGGGQ